MLPFVFRVISDMLSLSVLEEESCSLGSKASYKVNGSINLELKYRYFREQFGIWHKHHNKLLFL